MNPFQKLSAILKSRSKAPFPNTKHVIKHAFTVGGVDYFEFDTTANLPYKRGLKFLSIYNELDMKVDRFYLQKHVEAVEKILTGGNKIGFNEMVSISALNDQLKERLTWIHQEDLVYKLASVVFFDANESPDDWEWKYAADKIAHWKKHESVAAFFLHEPLTRLLPYLKDSNTTTQNYSETQNAFDKAQLDNILAILLENQSSDSPTFTERLFWEEMKQNSA